jgi:demethoxyubiquinone hydroxylase (CLK1/Coq7/Cat5 family)
MAIDTTTGDFGEARSEDTIDALNGFLRGEISAVETYQQALQKIKEPTLRPTLEACLRSHEQRVAALRERVTAAGGRPVHGSGAWGSFARLVQGGAKVFGIKAALVALEEGEDHGKKMYGEHRDRLDPTTRLFVERELLPLQEHSHNALSALKRSIH